MKVTKEQVRKEIESGSSIYSIAKRHNTCISNVYDKVKRLGIKSKYRFPKDGGYKKEWRKLSRNNKMLSRIMSLPSCYIKEIGIDPEKKLEGKWIVKDNKLILEIRECQT